MASFGKIVIERISCKGLRAADSNAFGKDSSDPYCRLTLISTTGTQDKETSVLKKTVDPVWSDRIEFDLYEHDLTMKVEVFDKDAVGDDDSLGEYRFQLVEGARQDLEADLLKSSQSKKDAKGTLHMTYMVHVDTKAEWSQAFEAPAVEGRKSEKKTAAPKFSFTVTKESATRLMSYLPPVTGTLNWVMGVLRWKNPIITVVAFLLMLLVCIKSWFFQFICGCIAMLFWYHWMNSKGYLNFLKAKKPSLKPGEMDAATLAQKQAAAAQANEGGGGLGVITQLLFNLANQMDKVADLLTWKYPQKTRPVAIATLGLFGVSWFLPVWFLVLLVVLYIFTLEAVYTRYPVFRRRFPPGRMVQLGINWVKVKCGLPAVPVPKPFRGKVTVTLHEGDNLRDADSGPFGGKSDPFATVTCGDTRKQSKTVEGSNNPKWNQEFELPLETKDNVLVFQVWDDDGALGGDNDFLGETEIAFSGVSEATNEILELHGRRGTDDASLFITGSIKVSYKSVEVEEKEE